MRTWWTSPPIVLIANGLDGPVSGRFSLRSAAFLYDVAGFTTKRLRDLAADQKLDGAVFHAAPENNLGKSEAVIPAGSAGYSDAAVIVPWRIYRAYATNACWRKHVPRWPPG
jgi:hypothetical protein